MKIQPVSVMMEKSVVSTMMLDVSTSSLPIALAMMKLVTVVGEASSTSIETSS